jgi:hypothetical protein
VLCRGARIWGAVRGAADLAGFGRLAGVAVGAGDGGKAGGVVGGGGLGFQAVAIYRELAAAYPDRYRPDLATSLRVLARVLESLGQIAEAGKARSEAEQLNRP